MYRPRELPPKPKLPKQTSATTVVSNTIFRTCDRVQYFSGWDLDEYDNEEDEEEIAEEVNPENRRRIRMVDVLEKLPPDVSVEDLYMTASFSDDYLNLAVCYDQKINLYDKQMTEYTKKMEAWKTQKEYYDKDVAQYEIDLKKELASIKKS